MWISGGPLVRFRSSSTPKLPSLIQALAADDRWLGRFIGSLVRRTINKPTLLDGPAPLPLPLVEIRRCPTSEPLSDDGGLVDDKLGPTSVLPASDAYVDDRDLVRMAVPKCNLAAGVGDEDVLEEIGLGVETLSTRDGDCGGAGRA